MKTILPGHYLVGVCAAASQPGLRGPRFERLPIRRGGRGAVAGGTSEIAAWVLRWPLN
jgi:hypothetical protein